jgi:hypothetical protein
MPIHAGFQTTLDILIKGIRCHRQDWHCRGIRPLQERIARVAA